MGEIMQVELRFDNRVNSIEAIQKALYRVASEVDFDIEIMNSTIKVLITGLDLSADSQKFISQIKQHVNDYSLREKIGKDTEGMRNLVLASAFSRIIEQNNLGEQQDQ
jgi:His-Xaa-Ser system protein HxsD